MLLHAKGTHATEAVKGCSSCVLLGSIGKVLSRNSRCKSDSTVRVCGPSLCVQTIALLCDVLLMKEHCGRKDNIKGRVLGLCRGSEGRAVHPDLLDVLSC